MWRRGREKRKRKIHRLSHQSKCPKQWLMQQEQPRKRGKECDPSALFDPWLNDVVSGRTPPSAVASSLSSVNNHHPVWLEVGSYVELVFIYRGNSLSHTEYPTLRFHCQPILHLNRRNSFRQKGQRGGLLLSTMFCAHESHNSCLQQGVTPTSAREKQQIGQRAVSTTLAAVPR